MENVNKEKKTMTEDELNQTILDTTRKHLDEFAEKAIEDKLGELAEGLKVNVDKKVKEALLDHIKPTEEELETEEKANEGFKNPKRIYVDGKLENEDEIQKVQAEYLEAIIKAKDVGGSKREVDERLISKTAGHMVEGEDSQGGFLVPEVYKADLKMIALENSVVRTHGATVIPPIKTDSVKIPYIDDADHSSTVFGGVQAKWTEEKGEKDATKPAFGQLGLTPHKLAGITYLAHELRDDSAIALVPLIKRMFGSAWGYFEDLAFIEGSGAGQPLGIQNCSCIKTVDRNTASRVLFEDLREMYACMLPASHPYAVWVINPSVLPDLIGMTSNDSVPGTGTNPIWINRDMGAQNPIPGRIFGRPFVISEKMPGLGSQGDVGYFDMRYYLIFDRQPMTIDFSSHVGFITDEDCWRFVLRVAGQCWPQSVFTPRNAAAPVTTMSPFVVLDDAIS